MTTSAVRSPGQAKKGCICHAILSEGQRLFQSTANIYIYIYIYGKRIKVKRKLNFATLCLHVRESCKASEESYKACEESYKAREESSNAFEKSGKAPCDDTSNSPFWKGVSGKIFFALLKTILLG